MTGFTQPCAKAQKYEIFAYNSGTVPPNPSISIIVNSGAQQARNITVTTNVVWNTLNRLRLNICSKG